MNTIVQFLLKHGYSFLFGAMFAHQIGFPVPGPLFLLAAGALAASGRLGVAPALGVAISACVLADLIWYEAGRRKGDKVLHFIHRLTRDPDAHDRRAKRTFALYGPPILIVAKFIPGLDAVAPPLAGTSGTSRLRFLAFETLGVSLYACVYFGLGHMFSHDLDHAAQYVGRAGKLLAGLMLAAIFIYGLCKVIRRHRSSTGGGQVGQITPGSIVTRGIHPLQNEAVEDAAALSHPRITEKANSKGDPSMIKKFALLIITFAILAFSPLSRAQDQEPAIDSTIALVRANMQADRTAFITTGMNFNDKEGAAFWPIYQQYDYERSKVDDRRAAVLKQYAQKYPNLTNAEAKAMADQMLDCESRLAQLKKKYYKKFNKALPALTVTKFFQMERRIDLMMDIQVEAALPPVSYTHLTLPTTERV